MAPLFYLLLGGTLGPLLSGGNFVFLFFLCFLFLSFCLFVFLYFCLFVFLSFCLSVFLYFCLFAFLSFLSWCQGVAHSIFHSMCDVSVTGAASLVAECGINILFKKTPKIIFLKPLFGALLKI